MLGLLKIFDLVPGWVWAAITAVALLMTGVFYVKANAAKTELANYRAEVAMATAKAQDEARAREAELQRNADKIARNAHERETKLRASAATANLVAGQLRDDIARLNARATPEDPGAAAYAHEARTSRELLGSCADRYRDVAQEADGLRDQVTGLQEFVTQACRIER